MTSKHHAFESPIFSAYRQKDRKIKNAIKFLNAEGYDVYEKKIVKIPENKT